MASLRRLLEEDLKLEKESLDLFKKFINKELDEVSTLSWLCNLLSISEIQVFLILLLAN
jgi:hypothetical protein